MITLVATGALVLGSGAADQPVAGAVIWSDTAFAWIADEPLLPGVSRWDIAPVELPTDGFTVSLAARFTPDSDPGAAWGIWLEQVDGTRVIYAISGEQYTTTRVCDSAAWLTPEIFSLEDCPTQRADWTWNWYVRLNPVGAANTLTLHREASGEVRLRINRETLGAAVVTYSGHWGVWRRGGRAVGASLGWESAVLRTRSSAGAPRFTLPAVDLNQ